MHFVKKNVDRLTAIIACTQSPELEVRVCCIAADKVVQYYWFHGKCFVIAEVLLSNVYCIDVGEDFIPGSILCGYCGEKF